MEIKVERDNTLGHYDTGGGVRDVNCLITINGDLPLRVQRQVAIYETLGTLLGYSLSHRQLEDITDTIMDVLDQLEPI